MKRWTALLLSLLSLPSVALAQSLPTVSGFVFERSSGEPLEGAEVTVVGGKANDVVTDSDGTFILTLRDDVKPGSPIRIHIEKPGYASVTKTISVSSTIPLRVLLKRIKGVSRKVTAPPTTIVVQEPQGNCRIDDLSHCSKQDLQRNVLVLATLIDGLRQDSRNKMREARLDVMSAKTDDERKAMQQLLESTARRYPKQELLQFRTRYRDEARRYRQELTNQIPGQGEGITSECFNEYVPFCDFRLLVQDLRRLAALLPIKPVPTDTERLGEFVNRLDGLADEGMQAVQICQNANGNPDPQTQQQIKEWENKARALMAERPSEIDKFKMALPPEIDSSPGVRCASASSTTRDLNFAIDRVVYGFWGWPVPP